MSTSLDLIPILKAELKASGMSYRELAAHLNMAESSVKRLFSKAQAGRIPLSKIDAICQALKLDFSELTRRLAASRPLVATMSIEQEKAVVANRELMLLALCVLGSWTFEQIVSEYDISEVRCTELFVALDRIGIIELRPFNRYQLRLAKTFRWLPDGPVMSFFRQYAVKDFFTSNFDKNGEGLLLLHGSIDKNLAARYFERLQKLAQEFSSQHFADRHLSEDKREGFTLLLAMRHWEFALFEQLKRSK